MTQNPDLHHKILELSDAISRLNRQILDPNESHRDFHAENHALMDRCDVLLDEYRKEKARQNGVAIGYEIGPEV